MKHLTTKDLIEAESMGDGSVMHLNATALKER